MKYQVLLETRSTRMCRQSTRQVTPEASANQNFAGYSRASRHAGPLQIPIAVIDAVPRTSKRPGVIKVDPTDGTLTVGWSFARSQASVRSSVNLRSGKVVRVSIDSVLSPELNSARRQAELDEQFIPLS